MKNKINDITLLGVMTSIVIVMFLIPGLSFIPVGSINATIGHIPVIVLAIVKGPKLGAILGGIFGLTSLINAIIRPNLTSVIFMNPIISVLPRVMIGLITGYVFLFFKNRKNLSKTGVVISSAIGSLTNTVGVLSLIVIFYLDTFANATGNVGKSAVNIILGIASTNGLIEMLFCVLVSTPIAVALLRLEK